jgi:uncharacterized protein (DUF1501 family)
MKNESPITSRASNFSRRALLGGSASLAAATALSGTTRAAPRTVTKPVLIQVFLRLGMDGLTTVVPYGDTRLYSLRPTLAIQPPGTTNGALDLDGFFGLAPAAAPLLTPYNDGRLVFVHAVGSMDTTRSHFEAFELMELGDPSLPLGSGSSGWAARYLIETAATATADLRGIAVGGLPLTLNLAPQTLPIGSFYFKFPGRASTSQLRQDALLDAYSGRQAIIRAPAIDTIASFGFGGIDFTTYVPENGAVYPSSKFGTNMKHMAALLKQEVGVEVISINYEGWDLHANLGPLHGPMSLLLNDLSRSLEAFYLDMLGRPDDYVIVAMSEFGRHVRENGSAGVDHGHGNAMFVMGNVNGGQVIADWPGMGPGELDQGDLAITIDYRDILGELLQGRFGVGDLAPIFPGHTLTPHGVV